MAEWQHSHGCAGRGDLRRVHRSSSFIFPPIQRHAGGKLETNAFGPLERRRRSATGRAMASSRYCWVPIQLEHRRVILAKFFETAAVYGVTTVAEKWSLWRSQYCWVSFQSGTLVLGLERYHPGNILCCSHRREDADDADGGEERLGLIGKRELALGRARYLRP